MPLTISHISLNQTITTFCKVCLCLLASLLFSFAAFAQPPATQSSSSFEEKTNISEVLPTSHSDELNTEPLEKVSLQLKWLHQFQFAGYYAAKIKGFYEEAGLDVTIKERDLLENNIEQVINGESEYGISDSMVMLYQAKSAPLTIISAIFQHSPQVFLTLKSSGLDSPYDLAGKEITFYQKDTDGFPLLSMLHDNNITVTIERLGREPTPNILASGDTKVIPAYLSNEPFYFHERNIDINVIHPMNYGIDLYGDLIFTHHDEIKNHPERVENFKSASIKGWQYALDNKEEIINYIINDLEVDKSFAQLMFEANAIERAIGANFIPLGSINPGRIEHIQKLFEKHNLIANDLDLSRGIYQPEVHELKLSRVEKAWITRNPVVKVAIDQAWHPIEFIDENGQYVGVVRDFLTRLHILTGIKFEPQTDKNWDEAVTSVKNGEVEMFAALIETPERNQYLNFTPTYLNFPMVIATQKGENYISNLNNLTGKTIAVVKNYAAEELIAKDFPGINLYQVDSVKQGLEAVSKGLVYGYADNLAVVGYNIRSLGLTNLQISGETPFKADIKMGVIKELPELHSIISKALLSISEEQKTQIANKWMQIEYKRDIDWYELFIYILPLSGIALMVMFYARKIKKLNNKLKNSNTKLTNTKKSLEASNQRLEILSVTDFLTGAFNRQYIDSLLEQEIERASRHQTTFSILLIDLDNFKTVNDDYGHLEGDNVLKEVYQCMASNIRKTDTVGRWGGEEFIVICPETSNEQACNLAEKLINKVQKLGFSNNHQQTISIGVAQHLINDSLSSIVERADNHLYQAKSKGKNQAIC